MTDEQQLLTGYKSKVHEQGDFENPNEGKPFLEDTDEYVLTLIATPRVIPQTKIKEDKSGIKKSIKVDTAVCEFQEKNTKNVVVAFFRVDSLNFSSDESFESGVIRFFRKIKHPLTEGVSPDWGNYFIPGMRFRSRVVVKTDKDTKKPTGIYYLDVPTCRPLLASDTVGEDFEQPSTDAPKTNSTALCLANAKLIVKGCQNRSEAILKLYEAKVPNEIMDAFKAADDDKLIVYPI